MRHHTLLLIFWVLSLGIIQAVPLLNGADQIDKIVSLLKSKRVGLVVNHTSLVGDKQTHLLDALSREFMSSLFLHRNTAFAEMQMPEKLS
ncbi:MAG: hypothetical protein V8R52_06605 [Coprobacter fastidiosus]